MKNETFTPERIKAEADAFFEWDGEDRSLVTTTSCLLFAQHIAGLMQARSAQPAPVVPEGSIYVECRQCDKCQHVGINDAAHGLAACHDCDWSGNEPEDDKCPGCKSENCMAAACPECGARYALIAGEDVAAAPAQWQQVEFGDAYQGAREDLAIWKRRALEAEAKVRHQDQIIDQMGEDLNAINGPTFMGEPVLPAAQDQGEVQRLRKALSEARELIEHGDFREGHCMCGNIVDDHTIGDGHAPTDAGVYYAGQVMERIDAALAASTGQEVKP